MSTETQDTLDRLAQVRNVADRGEIKKPAVRLLRYRERQERQEELTQISQQLAAPPWAQAAMTAEGRRNLTKRKRQLEKELVDWSPRTDLSSETKDALYKRSVQLEEEIQRGMPTTEVMRRNPVGAVDAHRKWNRLKDKVLEWKNIQVQLEPDSEDQDLANVERLRPTQAMRGEPATFMADAQIPGHFAMSPQAKENWPLGEPTADTVVKQAKRVTKTRVVISDEERKAIGQRLLEARRKKGLLTKKTPDASLS